MLLLMRIAEIPQATPRAVETESEQQLFLEALLFLLAENSRTVPLPVCLQLAGNFLSPYQKRFGKLPFQFKGRCFKRVLSVLAGRPSLDSVTISRRSKALPSRGSKGSTVDTALAEASPAQAVLKCFSPVPLSVTLSQAPAIPRKKKAFG